jgi:hypothetical protein
MVGSPSTTRNSPAVMSSSATRYSQPFAALHGVHSSPRQPGLRYKRGSGDRTSRPRNLAVTSSVLELGSCGALRRQRRREDRLAAGSRSGGVEAQPTAGRSLFGGGADRGVVLGGQVLDAIGVRRGSGGCSAVVVAEPAPPDHGVHRRHRVDADHLGGWETDVAGRQTVTVMGCSLPERWMTSVRRVARRAAVRSCGVGSKLGRLVFSGQLLNCYIMLLTAGSGTRRRPLAESGIRVP